MFAFKTEYTELLCWQLIQTICSMWGQYTSNRYMSKVFIDQDSRADFFKKVHEITTALKIGGHIEIVDFDTELHFERLKDRFPLVYGKIKLQDDNNKLDDMDSVYEFYIDRYGQLVEYREILSITDTPWKTKESEIGDRHAKR